MTPIGNPVPGSNRFRTFRGMAGPLFRTLQVRLRFVAVFAVAFGVVGKWESIRNHYERLTRLGSGSVATSSAVSNDTEYFCPMDPGVVSAWPGKCGICNMGLVRRKRGEAVPLPSGVVARMQFSPYRIQLAGVRTSPVGYRALSRETVLDGTITDNDTVVINVSGRDVSWLQEGHSAQIECDALPGRIFNSKVKAVHSSDAVLTLESKDHEIRRGMRVTARLHASVAETEPFRSQPVGPPPLRKGESRTIHLCATHDDVLEEAPGNCPVDGKNPLERQSLPRNQRLVWWCPVHPNVRADHRGEACAKCGGMNLAPRVLTYRPTGQVLAVPESAVVDTGLRKVVYVETMPGMFDGIEVMLGPRSGDEYPVIKGLEEGMRVATAGAFLIDAETRLNPALASAYFGAARKASPEPGDAGDLTLQNEVPLELRSLMARQRICPVTGKLLGSMGIPLKVEVAGRVVLVCCEGCEGPLRKAPEKYLARLNMASPEAALP